MPSINLAYQWAVTECNKDNVGYSQDYRAQQTVNGITYYDCSSFIWYALLNGGFDVVSVHGSNYPFTTRDMGDELISLGFVKHNATDVEWLSGDVVWRTGHVEMVYNNQRTMGAHTDEYELKDQVSINTYNSDKSSYTYLYRYGGTTPTPTPTPIPMKKRKMPIWLMI